jgi:hypothetical protein
MTIQDCGLAAATTATSAEWGIRIYESGGTKNVYFMWSCEFEEYQESFVIKVRRRGYLKGMSAQSAWSGYYSKTIAASKCNPHYANSGGRVYYAVSLQDLGITDIVITNKSWGYASRKFDSVEFEFSIYSNYTSDFAAYWGSSTSETAYSSNYVGYIPNYYITNAYYKNSNTLAIAYSTTWARIDDRFEVQLDDCYVLTDKSKVFNTAYCGTISGRGLIEIPTTYLRQTVADKYVHLKIRWNAAYRDIGMDFSTAEATVKVISGSTTTDTTSPSYSPVGICNPPTITLLPSDDPYSVKVRTAAGGGLYSKPTACTVKLKGSEYSADEVTVNIGETAELKYLPFGQDVILQAIGETEDAVSNAVELNAGTIPSYDNVMIDDPATGSRVESTWHNRYSVTSEGDYDIIKLGGERKLPSAFYASNMMNKSFTLNTYFIDDDCKTLEAMPIGSSIVIRLPDGRRYCVAAKITISGNVSFDHVKEVKISGDVVDL